MALRCNTLPEQTKPVVSTLTFISTYFCPLEISSSSSSSLQILKVFLDVFDYLALVIFIFEILLKWADGFFEFWKNGWNIFDFFVTTVVMLALHSDFFLSFIKCSDKLPHKVLPCSLSD